MRHSHSSWRLSMRPPHKLIISLFLLIIFGSSLNAEESRPGAIQAKLPTCKGINVVEEMRILEPQRYAQLKRHSEIETNSDAILWRIEGAEGEPSYLFGTLHATDPGITKMTGPVKAAFEAAQSVAVEVTTLDAVSMQSYIQNHAEVFFSIKGPKLNDYLTQEDFQYVVSEAVKLGMPENMIPLLKPWFAYISYFQLPGCESFRVSKGLVSLDQMIIQKAKLAGKRLVGLETLHDQFSAFAALAPQHQVTLLQNGIHQHRRVKDLFFTAMELYKTRQLGMMVPLSIALGKDHHKTTAAMAEFLQIMVVQRNKQMFENSLPLVKNGGAFIAVGALHMIGREGLVEYYRREGYSVVKVY